MAINRAIRANPTLRIDDLTRRFSSVTALDRVSFAVNRGEVVALLGENGAGKSTLVEILGGGLRPDAGAIEVSGRSYRPRDPRRAWERGICVVHQHFQLVEAFTVGENLRLSSPTQDLTGSWRDLAADLDQKLPALDAVVRALGVGKRQWLEIGKALLRQPRLLLLDEPTAVLTPGESERLFAVIQRLADRGTAVLFITHRLDEVQKVADRVVVLRRGRVVAELEPSAPSRAIAEAMTGKLPPVETAPASQPGEVVARLCEVAAPPRLQALSLELRSGEVVVLAGVDGSGQVAAAERLCGLTQGQGTIEIRGERFANAPVSELRRLGICVIPSDRSREGGAPGLSVAENLVLGHPLPVLLSPAAVNRRAEELISRFGIAGRAEQPFRELSGGNQQKVVVARALAARPELLVAIHPTRGLDVAAQQAVREQLLAAAAGGTAVLLVTADLDEARSTGDRILVFSRGRVVGEGDRSTPPELLARWVGGEAA
jgi:simple sugar transport system ATP-binding protein